MDARQTVLLVDDDVDFVEANRIALEATGYQVLIAHDGEEGLALARANPVTLAVIDVMMRRPDEGFDLARRLRADARTRAIPLLMLTSVNREHRQQGLLPFSDRDRDDAYLPVDRFIDKPLPPRRLVQLVQETLA